MKPSRCAISGHGQIIRRSDAMGDFFCPDCLARHISVFVLKPTPGRRLVLAEAERRGGTCEFEMGYPTNTENPTTIVRCAARFQDGGLHWHHIDPSTKIATISSLAVGARLEVLAEELAKCRLLCRGHHKIEQRRAV